MTDPAAVPEFEVPPAPPADSPGSEPTVTPIPGQPGTEAGEEAAGIVPTAAVPPVVVDEPATVRVRVMAGQSIGGVGVVRAGVVVDVPDNAVVRGRIESGFLQLAD